MDENGKLHNSSITEHFKTLYATCDIADEINRRIDRLKSSSGDKSTIEDEIDRLQVVVHDLMMKRIRFIRFTITLDRTANKVLELRCEECLSWKNIAFRMNLSETTVRRLYKQVCEAAEKYGDIF